MCAINPLEIIVSFKDQELIIKPEVAQLSSFLRGQLDHLQREFIDLDHLLMCAESTNSLGIRKAITFEHVAMVFSLVEKIYTTWTPRSDGGYVAQQVQLDVDYALINYDNTFLGNVCRIAIVLGIPFLVNACASTIMARPGIVEGIIALEEMDDVYIPADVDCINRYLFETDFGVFEEKDCGRLVQGPIFRLFLKHFLLKKGNIQELSIADYLYAYSRPDIQDSVLSFENKKLTSLDGLSQIADKESVTSLCLQRNFLYDALDVKGLFSGFTNLQVLNVAHSNLKTLPDFFHMGWGVDTLRDIQLAHNQLKYLDKAMFLGLNNLEVLNLSHNTIETLPANVFEQLSSLDVLDLSNNKNLQKIHSEAFEQLYHVRTLNLAHCGLSELPATVFDNLGSLNSLDLSDNQLRKLDLFLFSNLANLEILDLRGNNLEIIFPTNFSDNRLLTELYLGENRLTSESLLLGKLRRLRVLSLGHRNPFGESERCTCCHDYECCDKGPFDTSAVKNNSMGTLPKQLFGGFCHLEELDLNSLGLTHLDQDMFASLTTLKVLNMSNNKLKTLPAGIFKDLTNLETLDLRYNKLLYIDAHIFDSLYNLKELKLCHNLFSHLPKKIFHKLKNLEMLTIEHNSLKEFDLTMLEGLIQLKTVLLGNKKGE